ncbi:MAG: CRISPR-associated protein Cas4 [Anaerolineae bacterium]|jgi:CRISPR-associated exonuclease Cas4|nr:CRISPR-associated protein Cas4 [Anaerolineae bacterium]
MTNNLERPLIVEDLKQYTYCRRIVYYQRCTPGIRPRTFSMDAGKEDHLEARQNARRRSFVQMGFEQGRREFDVDIIAADLNLHGKLDEVVTTDTGEVIPVEYKGTNKVAANHKIQVAAYAVLLESARGVTVKRAYVYLIPLRKAQLMPVKPEDKAHVRGLLAEMAQMVAGETMPPPTSVRSRCAGCEFRRFCNDV